jgi:hypothetical protein
LAKSDGTKLLNSFKKLTGEINRENAETRLSSSLLSTVTSAVWLKDFKKQWTDPPTEELKMAATAAFKKAAKEALETEAKEAEAKEAIDAVPEPQSRKRSEATERNAKEPNLEPVARDPLAEEPAGVPDPQDRKRSASGESADREAKKLKQVHKRDEQPGGDTDQKKLANELLAKEPAKVDQMNPKQLAETDPDSPVQGHVDDRGRTQGPPAPEVGAQGLHTAPVGTPVKISRDVSPSAENVALELDNKKHKPSSRTNSPTDEKQVLLKLEEDHVATFQVGKDTLKMKDLTLRKQVFLAIKGAKEINKKAGEALFTNSQVEGTPRKSLRVEFRNGSVLLDFFKDTADSVKEHVYAKIAFNGPGSGFDIFVALTAPAGELENYISKYNEDLRAARQERALQPTDTGVYNGPVFDIGIDEFDEEGYDTGSENDYEKESWVNLWPWKLRKGLAAVADCFDTAVEAVSNTGCYPFAHGA